MGSSLYPVAAIIPSLNPDGKLINTVHGLLKVGFTDVIVVDDGSREDCQNIFKELEALPECQVLHHAVNQGKGRALKTAFSYYLEHYDMACYHGVVTADADGQHLPEDIMKVASAIMSSPGQLAELSLQQENTLALGIRDFDEAEVPFKSRFGNKITTYVFYALYGKTIRDTQTGLRAISNDFLKRCIEIQGDRFEYEIKMLIDSVLQKAHLQEIPIQTVYFDDNRETHFRPVLDSIRIYRVMLSTFFRFAGSGILCMLIDQGLFAIFQRLIFTVMNPAWSIPLSTFFARLASSGLNFTLNRAVVFEKRRHQKSFLLRYYGLCIAQMAVSAFGVLLLYQMTHINTNAIKLLVDMALFFISYRIQQQWVFKER